MNNSKWYEKSYRRNLIDMHIEDWDEMFLSNYDSNQYIEFLKLAHIQSAMVYANSHVGHCYFPTQSGHMHAGLKGRDILREVTEGAHQAGMDVIFYYSLIFNNWSYEKEPSWRMIDVNGRANRDGIGKNSFGTRYGVCCPNSEGYRVFLKAQLKELCTGYQFEGVFFDMTFWPMVCYCDSCRERFGRETGMEIPTEINWEDPVWLEFQKKREEWISEFAAFTTNEIKKHKPGVSVEHQCAHLTNSWMEGVTEGVAEASEYVGGDLYGGFHQQSFVCKLYHNMTSHQPFEYMTSRCYPNLLNHTTMKSRQMLELHTYLTLAHSGAFLIIDAIDLDGGLNRKVYETIGEVFGTSKAYEAYLGGTMKSDAAIFFSQRSKMNFEDNGKTTVKATVNMPHRTAALGVARILRENHIPFDVISNTNLDQLSSYQILILPDLHFISEEETNKIIEFVRNGGCLYFSGHTPLECFSVVLGISPIGYTDSTLSYMVPAQKGNALMPEVEEKHPLFISNSQRLVKPDSEWDILATIGLPYTDPADASKFASIHSNPPGKYTSYPNLISRQYGKGTVVWAAAPIEAEIQEPHRNTFARIIRSLAAQPFKFTVEAHSAAEVVLFEQEEQKRFMIHVVNVQEQFPLISLSDIRIRVKLNGKKATQLSILPNMEKLEFLIQDDYATFVLPRLEVYSLLELVYG